MEQYDLLLGVYVAMVSFALISLILDLVVQLHLEVEWVRAIHDFDDIFFLTEAARFLASFLCLLVYFLQLS